MADREITYKPVLDTSEIQAQMVALQEQLNSSMGAQPFSTPVMPGPTFTSTAAVPTESPIASMPDFSANIAMHMAMSKVRESSDFAKEGMANISNAVYTGPAPQFVAQAPPLPDFSISYTGGPDIQNEGMFKTAWRSIGFGFDPNAGMTRLEYNKQVAERLGSTEFAGNIAGLVAGGIGATAVGTAIGGPLGFVAGLATDLAIDATIGWMNQPNVDAERMGRYIQKTSWKFDSEEFSRSESFGIAKNLQSYFNTREFRDLELSRSQGEQIINTFTSVGGFDSVRTAQEYVDRSKELMATSQRISQLLQTSIEEATTTMGQLMQMGIVSTPTQAMELAYSIESKAGMAGMSKAEMLALSQTGLGLGFSPNAGFTGLGDIAVDLRQSVVGGYLSRGDLAAVGGQSAAATMIAQGAASFGQTPLAITMALSQQAGMDPFSSDNLLGTIAFGSSQISGPGDLLEALGGQKKWMSKIGPEALGMYQALTSVSKLRMTGINVDDLSVDALSQGMYMLGDYGSQEEARVGLGLLGSNPFERERKEYQDMIKEQSAANQKNLVSELKGDWHSVQSWFGKVRPVLGDFLRYSMGVGKPSSDVQPIQKDAKVDTRYSSITGEYMSLFEDNTEAAQEYILMKTYEDPRRNGLTDRLAVQENLDNLGVSSEVELLQKLEGMDKNAQQRLLNSLPDTKSGRIAKESLQGIISREDSKTPLGVNSRLSLTESVGVLNNTQATRSTTANLKTIAGTLQDVIGSQKDLNALLESNPELRSFLKGAYNAGVSVDTKDDEAGLESYDNLITVLATNKGKYKVEGEVDTPLERLITSDFLKESRRTQLRGGRPSDYADNFTDNTSLYTRAYEAQSAEKQAEINASVNALMSHPEMKKVLDKLAEKASEDTKNNSTEAVQSNIGGSLGRLRF